MCVCVQACEKTRGYASEAGLQNCMRMDMCAGMCIEMCIDMRIDKFIDIRTDLCTGMCIDMRYRDVR